MNGWMEGWILQSSYLERASYKKIALSRAQVTSEKRPTLCCDAITLSLWQNREWRGGWSEW